MMSKPSTQLLRVAIISNSIVLRAELRKLLTEAKILVTAESEVQNQLSAPFDQYMADVLLVAIHDEPQQKEALTKLLSLSPLVVVPYLHEKGKAIDGDLIKKLKEAASIAATKAANSAVPKAVEKIANPEPNTVSSLVIDYDDETQSKPPTSPRPTIYDDEEDLQATQATSAHQSIKFDVDASEVDISSLQDGETRAVVEWSVGSIVLDMYEIVGLVGEGAMGLVHRVHHRGWNMDLAVKTPRLEELQKAGAENFEREAETWVNLGLHQNIVSCYYVRRVGNVPRIFAEYIDGGDLNQWIRQGKVTSLAQILDVMIQFAWGLHHAHSQGFVHLDVKPANVMLTENGIAKVTDFGLTKGQSIAVGSDMMDEEDDNSLVTVDGLTPAYCSPEQVNELPLNYKADIWSWGVSVLEIFVGRLTWPFGPMAMSVLDGYLERGPVKPEIARMPDGVVDILRQCFQDKPANRPKDLLTVARQIQDIYQTLIGEKYPRAEPSHGVFTADTLNNRAVSLVDLEKYEDANELWEQALSTQPNHPESTYNQGLLLWRSGRLADDGLLAELSAAEDSYPHACLYQYLRGLIHLERVDGTAAMDALNSIPNTDSRREALENVLNAARSRLGRAHWAIKEYEQEHLAVISGLCVNANGSKALSCSYDGRLKLWDISTGHCYQSFQAHQNQLYDIAMQPNMEMALSAGEDSTIKMWNMKVGEQIGLLAGHTASVNAVWVSDDGTVAISGDDHAEVRIWHLPNSRCIRVLKGHKGRVLAVAMTPNKRYALSAGTDAILRIWDVKSGRCIRQLKGHEGAITALSASCNGRFILSGGVDTLLRLWDIQQGVCLKVMHGNKDVVTSIAIRDKGKYAISCAKDKTLRLWELESGRCFHTYQNDQPLRAGVLSMDGKFAITGDEDWKIKRWDINLFNEPYLSPMVLSQVHTSESAVTALQHYEEALLEATDSMAQHDYINAAQALRKARSQKGYGREQSALDLWVKLYSYYPRAEFFANWQVLEFKECGSSVTAVCFSEDNQLILSGSNEGYLQLWSVEDEYCIRKFAGHQARINAIALSQDKQLAISVAQNVGKVWDVKTGEFLFDLIGHNENISTVKISWDKRFAVTAGHDKSIMFWELEKGRCLGNIGWHVSHINAIALSDDGQYLASGSGGGLGQQDYTVFLWDLAKQERIASFKGHTANVMALTINQSNTQLLSAGRDHVIKLWNTVTGECERDFIGHNGSIHSLCLTPDGCFLLSADSNNQIKLWEVATGFCLHTFVGDFQGLQQATLSSDARYLLSAGDRLRLWMLDWSIRERSDADWDESARYILLRFLNQHTPYAAEFPEQLDSRQVSLAMSQRGQPVWQDEDVNVLLRELGVAGFGWLSSESVKEKLTQLSRYWRQTIKINAKTVTCPECRALEQRKPRCLECGHLLSDVGAVENEHKQEQQSKKIKKKSTQAKKEEAPKVIKKRKYKPKRSSNWSVKINYLFGLMLRIASVVILGVLIAKYMKWM